MSRTKKDTKSLSILVNLIIVIWMGYCTYNMLVHGLVGNMTGNKALVFRYYTIDSNLFAAASALVMLCTRITKGSPKSFATHFKFYGTCTVTVTLVTVMVFLGPMIGYKEMLAGDNLYMHLIGPVLCIVSFCFLDRGPKLRMGNVLKSLIFTVIYGVVYFLMVIVFEKWPDFYGFNMGGKWYVSCVAMLVGAFAIAVILKALHNDK